MGELSRRRQLAHLPVGVSEFGSGVRRLLRVARIFNINLGQPSCLSIPLRDVYPTPGESRMNVGGDRSSPRAVPVLQSANRPEGR